MWGFFVFKKYLFIKLYIMKKLIEFIKNLFRGQEQAVDPNTVETVILNTLNTISKYLPTVIKHQLLMTLSFVMKFMFMTNILGVLLMMHVLKLVT